MKASAGIYICLASLLLGGLFTENLAAQNKAGRVDVLHYHCSLELDFPTASILGQVMIRFKVPPKVQRIAFDSGGLKVTMAKGKYVKSYNQTGKKCHVFLTANSPEIQEITFSYSGKPKRGLLFLDNATNAHTVYFTEEWMLCNAVPGDRASLALDLIVPAGLTTVASGTLMDTIKAGEKVRHTWQQDYETPAYTYGFAIGPFQEWKVAHKDMGLHHYSNRYDAEEMKTIFQYTSDMVSFFEEKSGILLPLEAYSQVLMGDHYQEMSGFAMLKESYGAMILKDSTETNLISHELAHQWWGNSITCKSWSHFWLNEGFATFMSAAYNGHHFGKEKYEADVAAYFGVYDNIRKKGGDKPLVFPSWSNPSRDDRNLVYFKGAYVLHLLKEELGEEAFWKGIQHYSQTYYEKFVTTKDFQKAMEASSQRPLDGFFQKWVY